MARYTDHDEIAASALQLCEGMRERPVFAVYNELTRGCRSDAERMAQLLMCLAAWVDVEKPRDLIARAIDVAETNLRIAERMDPGDGSLREVLLRQPVTAPNGIVLAKDSRQLARPITGDQWLIQVGTDTFPVLEALIRSGARQRRTLLRARDAREEYEFARRTLGYSHQSAVVWLRDKFGASEKQLERWGLTVRALEIAS